MKETLLLTDLSLKLDIKSCRDVLMVNALGWVQIRDPGSLVKRRNSLTVPLSIQEYYF